MYAIPILEGTLDLIQVLNGGMRPQVEGTEENPTYFTFDIELPETTENHDIKTEEDLRKVTGSLAADAWTILLYK